MFATLLRLGAIIAIPLATAGAAAAQYDDAPQDDAALILFSGEDYTGDAVNVFDPIHALPEISFNDRARSVAVLSGAWEVCEHSDFTGRCVLLREDVPDLRYFDMDGEISSVRPIYEYTDAEHGLMFVRDSNGYIRYADAARYGYDDYDYGYARNTRVEVYHYGYSPAYRSYGYYDPLAGYGPYGFGYSRGGYNTYRNYHRERPPLRGHYGARDADATLYVDSNGRGASLGINRGVKDLSRYRFNDNVSSLNIKSGKWEVCEHANFQGRCQIIDASTGKLNGIRLNDNISSIRPVGGDRDDRRADTGRRDQPRSGDGRGNRGSRGQGEGREGRRSDSLAGGPGTVPALPDTTLPNRQPRAAPGFIPADPISRSVRQPRIERDARDTGLSATQRRDVSRTPRVETPRVNPVAKSPQRVQAPRAQPTQRRESVQRPQRVLPQTPAMRSRQPVVAAPQVRAPTRSVAPDRPAPVRAAPPASRPQPAPSRPNPVRQENARGPQKGRVGNNRD